MGIGMGIGIGSMWICAWLVQVDKKTKRATKTASKNAPPARKAEAPAAAPSSKGGKADKGRVDKKMVQPASAMQVLQRPEGATLRRPPRGHAFLDFEFKTHAVLAALD